MDDELPNDGAPAPADDTAMDAAQPQDGQDQQLAAPPHTMLPDPEVLDKLRRWANPNQCVNICDELEGTTEGTTILGALGQTCMRQREIDELSRDKWMKDNKAAMDLAMQVAEKKSFPWPDSSNVIYPIVSQAAVQFNARAYPAIVPDRNVVKGTVYGRDDGIPMMQPGPNGQPQPVMGPDGKTPQWQVPPGFKRQRADRIAEHMSYQLLEEMDEWQDETDRLLLILPIVGCCFRKTYFDSSEKRNFSLLVQARDLVVNYNAKSIDTAPRKTEEMKFYPHEIETLMRNGTWTDCELGQEPDGGDDEDHPRTFDEVHRFIDLDKDGFAEPYVVMVHRATQKVVRIVARFDDEENVIQWNHRTGQITKVVPTEYYTKFDFLPNPEGKFYGVGFGQLLKPINESVNTALNQLFDSGTLQNTGGGFIGRGLSMQTGSVQRKLGEWKVLNVPGNKIREAIVPAPPVVPSDVLFKLLGFMVEAGKEMAGNTDLLAGQQSSPNMPAMSVLALIEQGSKVFNAIYKRIYRASTREFDKLYRINRLYLDDVTGYRRGEEWKEIQRSDYEVGGSVVPASDPSMVSDMQRLGRAQVLQPFMNDPLVDGVEIRKRYFDAASIPEIDKLMQADPMSNPMLLFKRAELGIKMVTAKAQATFHMARAIQALALGDKAVGDKHLAFVTTYLDMLQMDLSGLDTIDVGSPFAQPPQGNDPLATPPQAPPGLGDPPGVGGGSVSAGMGFGGNS